VDYFVSELAVVHFIKDEFGIPRPFLEEISKHTTINDVLAHTGADLILSKEIKYLEDA
jgi:acyl CoA:acetate/3-ketoacid CoA transferase beta subunit